MSDVPRVLVAGTADAIDLVTRVLRREAELVTATSLKEAVSRLDLPLEVIVCSVRFDESRMFDFLQTLRQAQPTRPAKVICLRASPVPLAPATRHAIEKALEALGIPTFIDFPHVALEQGERQARERLRAAILDG